MKVLLQDIRRLETEAVIVGFYEDVRPLKGLAGELDWLLCGTLSDLIARGKLHGSLGDVALLTSKNKIPAPKIFMVGLGPAQGLSSAVLRRAARTAASSAVGAGVKNAALEFFSGTDMQNEAAIKALRDGLKDGAGDRKLNIALLAHDAASYEKISKLAGR